MASCKFTIPFTGKSSDVLLRAKSAIQNQGGVFEGDEFEGHFDVSVFGNTINGSYFVMEQDLNIVIDSKPFIVSCGTIESFLKNKLSS